MRVKVCRTDFSFSAAHHLPNHPKLCQYVHGHNYKLEVTVEGEIDPETGMVIDFQHLKATVWSVLKDLDHSDLNKLKIQINKFNFPWENPTAENMIEWIWNVLTVYFSENKRYKLNRLRLWETDNCYVELGNP
jgi:6-pyruvoyltetrahydropterin/6-carboxytetrahydropterin synthase